MVQKNDDDDDDDDDAAAKGALFTTLLPVFALSSPCVLWACRCPSFNQV